VLALFYHVLEFLSEMNIPNSKIAYVKSEGIFECYHFGQNGTGVFGAKRLFFWHLRVV